MKELSEITLYSPDGAAILTTEIGSGSKIVANLMQDDYIIVDFASDKVYRLTRGVYCFASGQTYILNQSFSPTYDAQTGGYHYELRMDAWYYSWNRYKFALVPQFGATQTSFNYTQTLIEHIRLIFSQLDILEGKDQSIMMPIGVALHYNGHIDWYKWTNGKLSIDWKDYMPTVDPDSNDATFLVNDDIKSVAYNDVDIISAISAMCAEEAFNCEWWMDSEAYLHFGRCEGLDAVNMRHGVEFEDLQRSSSSNEYGTRLIAFGSTQNIPSRYRKFVKLTATNANTTKQTLTFTTDEDAFKPEDEVVIDDPSKLHEQVFEYETEEIDIVQDMKFNISAEFNVVDGVEDYELGGVYLEGQVYLGDVLIGTCSDGEINVSRTDGYLECRMDLIYLVGDGLVGQTLKLRTRVRIIGHGGYNYDEGANWYWPEVIVKMNADTEVTTGAIVWDNNHLITSNDFFSEYRKGFEFGSEQAVINYLEPITYARTYVGKAFVGGNSVPGMRYTMKIEGDIYVELPEGESNVWYPTFSYESSNGYVLIWQLFNDNTRYEIAEKGSGLYHIEQEVDLGIYFDTRYTDIYASFQSLSAAGTKIYINDKSRGAWFKMSMSADYYDETKEEIGRPTNVKAYTQIYKTDEWGNRIGGMADCVVGTDGHISVSGGMAFEVGDLYGLIGVKDALLPLPWFTDKYNNTTLSSYTRRLMLPVESCPKNYIDSERIKNADGTIRNPEVVEVVKVFEDIYPSKVIDILIVEPYTDKRTVVDDDGKEVEEDVAMFRFFLNKSDFAFSQSAIMGGENGTLQCIFQTGKLSGMGFELHFDGDKRIVVPGNIDLQNVLAQQYTIILNSNYGAIEFPNEVLSPSGRYIKRGESYTAATADKIVMVNYNAAELSESGLVDAAERRLETAARAYLDKISLDAALYTMTMQTDAAEAMSNHLAIGQKVEIEHEAYFDGARSTRVIGYEIKLDIPWDSPQYKLGESLRYSRFMAIENKLK